MTQIEVFIFPSTQKSGIEPSPPNKPRGVARAYDADRIRNVIDVQDCRACIPPKSNRTDDIPYSRRLTVLKAQPDRTLLQQDQAISPHRTPIRSPRRTHSHRHTYRQTKPRRNRRGLPAIRDTVSPPFTWNAVRLIGAMANAIIAEESTHPLNCSSGRAGRGRSNSSPVTSCDA
jgi:hypothetical protein